MKVGDLVLYCGDYAIIERLNMDSKQAKLGVIRKEFKRDKQSCVTDIEHYYSVNIMCITELGVYTK